jgi:hypothetical protein
MDSSTFGGNPPMADSLIAFSGSHNIIAYLKTSIIVIYLPAETGSFILLQKN